MDAELGAGVDGELAPKTQREQLSGANLPFTLRMGFYDPDRDFQAAEVRAIADDEVGAEEQVELAAVLDMALARQLNQMVLARRWAERDTLTLRLPPRFAGLNPGGRVQVGGDDAIWIARRCTLEGFVLVVELRRAVPALSEPASDQRTVSSMRMKGSPKREPAMALALFDIPGAADWNSAQPTLLLAASSSGAGWRRPLIEVQCRSHSFLVQGPAKKSVLGRTRSALGKGESNVIDGTASVDIELIDRDQWLTSCDDDALLDGCNLALIGGELIQFGEATPTGPGRFRLSRLLRGRKDTERAMGGHMEGETFALIDPTLLVPIILPNWTIGSVVTARLDGRGGAASASRTLSGESLHHPVHAEIPVGISSRSSALIDGRKVRGIQCDPITSPKGGRTVDNKARTTLNEVLEALRAHGLIKT